MKRILLLVAVLMVGKITNAQTISPLFVEGKAKVKAQFSITNPSVSPMPVSVEAREMVMVDGKAQLVTPTNGVHVELQDTSGIVAPKSTRTFDYKITSDHDALIVLMAGMVNGRSKEGVTIKLWFPHSVYTCTDSAKDCRERVKKSLGMS
jgi:hypothetical protein